jgi:hypothetical protein
LRAGGNLVLKRLTGGGKLMKPGTVQQDGGAGIEYVDTWVSYPGRYKGTDGFGPIEVTISGIGTLGNPVELR